MTGGLDPTGVTNTDVPVEVEPQLGPSGTYARVSR